MIIFKETHFVGYTRDNTNLSFCTQKLSAIWRNFGGAKGNLWIERLAVLFEDNICQNKILVHFFFTFVEMVKKQVSGKRRNNINICKVLMSRDFTCR